jgi:hypothetical protein
MSKISSCLLTPWPDKEPVPLKWKVRCSSFVNGAWSADRPCFLLLRPLAKRVVLLNQENVLIDSRFLLEGEVLTTGSKIWLPVHRVTIGEPINGDSVQSNSKLMNPFIEESAIDQKVTPPSLSFTRGLEFEEVIRRKFGQDVNFSHGYRKRPFFLVAAFGRSNFKLDNHTVSLSLQSCFGGSAVLFQVVNLRERVFRFSVSSRSVGFEIYNSGKFIEKDFDLSIFLWGNGGPNWLFEEKKYYKELDEEWTTVSGKKSQKSVFQRLSFPQSNPATRVRGNSFSAPTSWPNSIPIKKNPISDRPKNYAQAVTNRISINEPVKTQNNFHSKPQEI